MSKNIALGLHDAIDVQVPLTPADAACVARFGTEVRTAFHSMNVDSLSEPLRDAFTACKSELDTMLASLAPTDQVPAAQEAHWNLRSLMSTLLSAQSLISGINGELHLKTTALNSLESSLDEKHAEHVTGLCSKGEIFTKEAHDLALTDATETGRLAAEKAFMDIDARRTALNSAKLPGPGNDVLAYADAAAFTAARGIAGTRFERLKDLGLPEDKVTSLCWSGSDEDFTATCELLDAVKGEKPAAKDTTTVHSQAINPFAQAASHTSVRTVENIPAPANLGVM